MGVDNFAEGTRGPLLAPGLGELECDAGIDDLEGHQHQVPGHVDPRTVARGPAVMGEGEARDG